MLSIDDARKLKRNDRIVVEKSGDTGRVTGIVSHDDHVQVLVHLDEGSLCSFTNFQIDHEEDPCPSKK